MGRKSRAKAAMRGAKPTEPGADAVSGRCGQCPYIDAWDSPQSDQPMHTCADPESCDLCFQDHLGTEDRRFYRRYPTREDFAAVAAAEGRVQLWFEQFDAGCQQAWLRADSTGLVRENRFYLPYYFREIIHTGLLNAGYREREWTHPAVKRAARALERYGEDHGIPAEARVFTDSSSDVFPRLGFAIDVRLPAETAWERVLDWVVDGPEDQTLRLVNPWDDQQDQASRELSELCQEHGLDQFTCGACGQPLTNRHPGWPGVWVAFGEEDGPSCRESPNGVGLAMPESYDRPLMPLPHRPLAASGVPPQLTRSSAAAEWVPGSRG